MPPIADSELGIAPGGLIKQCVLEDTHPAWIWDTDRQISFNVQILNSELFQQVTGVAPPDTPISARRIRHTVYPSSISTTRLRRLKAISRTSSRLLPWTRKRGLTSTRSRMSKIVSFYSTRTVRPLTSSLSVS